MQAIKYLIAICIFVFVIYESVTSTFSMVSDMKTLEFKYLFSRAFHSGPSTEVIPAEDDSVYMTQIKVIEKDSQKPVQNVRYVISGKSSKDINIDLEGQSDVSGDSKFNMDKGEYRISFLDQGFPEKYQKPSPFFFSVEKPGITLITVSLEKLPENDKSNFGILEIEVFDKNNQPVPNIELSSQNLKSEKEDLDRTYAISNQEGVAVMSLPQGDYKISFTEAKIPKNFHVQAPFEANVGSNTVTHYTIRLVEKAPELKITISPSPKKESKEN